MFTLEYGTKAIYGWLIGQARAKDLVYTGRFVDAGEALRIGLVDQVVPDGDVYDAATRLAASSSNRCATRRTYWTACCTTNPTCELRSTIPIRLALPIMCSP